MPACYARSTHLKLEVYTSTSPNFSMASSSERPTVASWGELNTTLGTPS